MLKSVDVQVSENGFSMEVSVKNGEAYEYKNYVYIKPSQVIKAFKEIMKPLMPERKPRKKNELKIGD